MEQGLSVEERLAQAMIDLRKGHTSETSNLSTVYRRDYLIGSIKNIKRQIDLVKKENDVLNGLRKQTDSIRYQINPILEIDAHLVPGDYDRCHGTRDISIQTESVTPELPNIPHKAEKFVRINDLTIKEQMLRDKLRRTKMERNHRGRDFLLLKKREYYDLVSQISGLENKINNAPSNLQPTYLTSGGPTVTSASSTLIGMTTDITTNSNNGVIRSHEESDDEGVQLLLSMKRSVFKCKCGEYCNSITDWSEHQRICSKSTEKAVEQCKLCNKTFLTCVALNIHSTKKHNRKKIRTDSVMHCPCGQSFTAKWRQNCVHKLNSHGRHCKAFKERETQCSICKKGFIDRKSLEYHGLKAHKLAVPINS